VKAVSFAELTRRGVIFDVEPAFEDPRFMLPRIEVLRAEISSASGDTWTPELFTNRARLKLLNDPEHPYERGETYRAYVELAYPFVKGSYTIAEAEFTPE